MDFNEQLEAIDDEDALEELDEEEADSGAIAAENLERLKVAGLQRFAAIRRLYTACSRCCKRMGTRRQSISICRRKFPRVDADPLRRAPGRAAVRQRALRGRQYPPDRAEDPGSRRQQGGMPRPDFIKKFPEHETSLRWIDREIAAHHPFGESLAKYARRSSSNSRGSSICRNG